MVKLNESENNIKLKELKSKCEGKWVFFQNIHKHNLDGLFNDETYYFIKEIIEPVSCDYNTIYKIGYKCKAVSIVLNSVFGDRYEDTDKVIDLDNAKIIDFNQIHDKLKEREHYWMIRAQKLTQNVVKYNEEELKSSNMECEHIWKDSEITDRGLEIARGMKDTYGNEIRLQQSSAACYDAIWLGLDGEFYKKDGSYACSSIHLDRPGAAQLVKALQAWLHATGCDENTDFTDDYNKHED